MDRYWDFLDKKQLAEAVLSFLLLQEFEAKKMEEVEEMKRKYEIFCY